MSEKKEKKVEETKEVKGEVIEIEGTEGTKSDGIEISSDVIKVIAGVAVSEVEGVASMAGGFAGGISEVLSGKKNFSKGIKVEVTDKKAKIDINIVVEYGSRIPEIAYEIQKRVKKSVEAMSGLTVDEVNVHVQGVKTAMEKEEEKQDEKEEEKKEEE